MPGAARSARFDAAAGALLSLGAPAGWLLLRIGRGEVDLGWDDLGAELRSHADLYLYLLLGTCSAFTVFGVILGDYADRLAQANAAAEERAITDVLTGLRNPRYFHERLIEECARSARERTPLALVMMDLDHFKSFNDRYGHAFGDRVLAHAAGVLSSCARATDVACRIGGEEFAVLCPGASLEDASGIAERVRGQLDHSPVIHDGMPLRVTASFGVAVCWPGMGSDDLFGEADRALYGAKAEGRNRVFVVGTWAGRPAAHGSLPVP